MSEITKVIPRTHIHPGIGIGIGVVAISTASIFVRLAQNSGAPSLTIAALRLTAASVVLLPFAWANCRDELKSLGRRDLLAAVLSGAFLGAHFATWITSLRYTSLSSSVVLVTLSPLFVAIGSALFLRERLSRMALAGIATAIMGGILISAGDASQAGTGASNPLLGNLLALAGAICIGPHFLIGRRLRQKLSLLAYISLVNTSAAFVLLIVVAITGSPMTGFDAQGYLWIVLLALLPQLIGHTSVNWSLGFLPATYATIPVLGEPIGATLLAIIIFGEVLTLFKVGGAFLTLGGIALMMVSRMNSDRVKA